MLPLQLAGIAATSFDLGAVSYLYLPTVCLVLGRVFEQLVMCTVKTGYG